MQRQQGGILMGGLPTILVGVITGAGGVFGYLKTGSVVSAVMGLVSSMVFIYSGTKIPQRSGLIMSIGWALLLGGIMGYRFLNSGKFMPAGLIASLSVSLLTYNTFLLLK